MPTRKKTKVKSMAKKKAKSVPKTPAGEKGVSRSASSKKASAKKSLAKKASREKTTVKKRTTAKNKYLTGSKRTEKHAAKAALNKTYAEANEEDSALAAGSPLSSLLHKDAHDDLSSDKDDIERTYVEMLIFKMAGKLYAFRVADVEEILQSQDTTLVPRTRDFVIGLTTVRGKIIPVIDISMLMEVSVHHEHYQKGKIVVLSGPSGSVGIRMQRDMDIVLLPEDDIQPPPGHLVEANHAFIGGIVKVKNDFVSILNTDKMLSISAARGAYEGEA